MIQNHGNFADPSIHPAPHTTGHLAPFKAIFVGVMYTGVTDAESKETGDAVKYPTMHMKVLPPPPKIELSGPNVNSVKILRNFALENKDIQDKGHRDCITSLLSLLAKILS